MTLTTALTVDEGALALSFRRGVRLERSDCRWSGCDLTPKISRMGEMGGVGSVGLKQQLRNVA